MKKKVLAVLLSAALLMMASSCSIPVIGDLFESESSLGKTNNTAVTIAAAMKDYLKNKKKTDLTLYGLEMILNSDGNGTVKLYYTAALPDKAAYSDIYVSEVDSKTGHVERFGRANYAKDGITPFQMVRECRAIDAASLPVDSEKAISSGVKAFSTNLEFYYDYVQIALSAPGELEQYEIRFISMLNDTVYYCTVDGVNAAVLASSVGALS